MQKDKHGAGTGLSGISIALDELVHRGARQVTQHVIELELELAALLEQYANVRTLSAKKVIMRNVYLPERDVLIVPSPVAVKVPKVHDRSDTSGSSIRRWSHPMSGTCRVCRRHWLGCT
jgi:putative transposase